MLGVQSVAESRAQLAARRKALDDAERELRLLVSGRYADLVVAAGAVARMESHAADALSCIGDIQNQTKSLVFGISQQYGPPLGEGGEASSAGKQSDAYGLARQAAFVVDAPERAWSSVDAERLTEAAEAIFCAETVFGRIKDVATLPRLVQDRFDSLVNLRSALETRCRSILGRSNARKEARADALTALIATNRMVPQDAVHALVHCRARGISEALHSVAAGDGEDDFASALGNSLRELGNLANDTIETLALCKVDLEKQRSFDALDDFADLVPAATLASVSGVSLPFDIPDRAAVDAEAATAVAHERQALEQACQMSLADVDTAVALIGAVAVSGVPPALAVTVEGIATAVSLAAVRLVSAPVRHADIVAAFSRALDVARIEGDTTPVRAIRLGDVDTARRVALGASRGSTSGGDAGSAPSAVGPSSLLTRAAREFRSEWTRAAASSAAAVSRVASALRDGGLDAGQFTNAAVGEVQDQLIEAADSIGKICSASDRAAVAAFGALALSLSDHARAGFSPLASVARSDSMNASDAKDPEKGFAAAAATAARLAALASRRIAERRLEGFAGRWCCAALRAGSTSAGFDASPGDDQYSARTKSELRDAHARGKQKARDTSPSTVECEDVECSHGRPRSSGPDTLARLVVPSPFVCATLSQLGNDLACFANAATDAATRDAIQASVHEVLLRELKVLCLSKAQRSVDVAAAAYADAVFALCVVGGDRALDNARTRDMLRSCIGSAATDPIDAEHARQQVHSRALRAAESSGVLFGAIFTSGAGPSSDEGTPRDGPGEPGALALCHVPPRFALLPIASRVSSSAGAKYDRAPASSAKSQSGTAEHRRSASGGSGSRSDSSRLSFLWKSWL